MIDSETLEALAALEVGVLIPTCNINEELAKLTPEEARKAKRKWRKLMRRASRAQSVRFKTRKWCCKLEVRRQLVMEGRRILNGGEE